MIPGLPCVLLAAGSSRRWAGGAKLLHRIEGEPMIRRTACALLAGGMSRLMVVTRSAQRGDLASALVSLERLKLVTVDETPSGLGTSLAVGVATLERKEGEGGFAVCPADLPWMQPDEVRRLLDAFAANGSTPVRPSSDGRPGHPVIFPWNWRDRLVSLRGPRGAGPMLGDRQCRWVPGFGDGVVRDVDYRADASEDPPGT